MPDILQRLRAAYMENPASALDILPEMLQAMDEGKVIELPCKEGGTVWILALTPCAKCKNGSKPASVCGKSGCPEFPMPVNFSIDMFSKIGKTVFLTREVAEAAIKAREKASKAKNEQGVRT